MKGDSYHFLKKQLLYVPVGLFAMFVTMNIDYRKLGKLSPIIMLVSLGCFLLCGLTESCHRNNATRWFDLGFVDFQPSEFAKLAMILFCLTVFLKGRIA